jgi:ATP-dependent Clp protease ATP-binding subunit ClpC
MFERFTDRARRVVVLAQEESRLLGHGHIGTEHLLLGLVPKKTGVAAAALAALGVDLETARSEVEEVAGRGDEMVRGHIPFTPRAKKALESSLREALDAGHDHIGTEHILLGIVRDYEGAAAEVLAKHAASPEAVRAQVRLLLAAGPAPIAAPPVCGRCGATLTDALTTTDVLVREHEGDGQMAVVFARCARCGAVVGLFPGGA